MKSKNKSLSGFFESVFNHTKLALGSLLLAALAVAVGGLVFFGWLGEEVLEGGTRNFDETIRSFVHQFAAPALTSVMQIASFLGSTVFLTLCGGCIFIVFWFLNWRRAAILFAITITGSSILLFVLKQSFRRPRPEPFFDTLLPASYSFPSGHSLISFCFYAALAAIVARRINRRLFQMIIWTFAASLIAIIGLSRIYLGVHYPSDVLAGYVAAFVWVVAVVAADRFLRYRAAKNKENKADKEEK